jgi:hypothetical protein
MIRRNAILIAAVLFLLSGAGRAQQGTTGTPREPKLTAEQRADALLRQMTVEEKAMQLSSVFPVGLFGPDGPIPSQLDAQLKDGIGHVAALGLIGHKTPEQIAKYVNAVQRYLVTQTRLKIPAIFHNEAMSGVVAPHFSSSRLRSDSRRRGTPRRRKRWQTSSGVRCGPWASSRHCRRSSTWPGMPAGEG